MVYRAASGSVKPYLGLRLKCDSSLSGLCIKTGTPLRCNDSETDRRLNREACRKILVRSMIVMPLQYNESTVGVLKVISAQRGKFTQSDVRVLELLSELLAASMFFASQYDIDDLFHKATHDGLTGLSNRSMFMDKLRSLLLISHREQRPAGVVMIDMNGLKRINDTHGHRTGDAVIAEFSARLKHTARTSDTVARLGGDEFGIVLSPIELPHGLKASVKRIHSALNSPFQFEDKAFILSASVGTSLFPHDGNDINSLIELADQRMYINKKQHYQLQIDPSH